MPDSNLKDFDGDLSKALSPESRQGGLDCTLAKGSKIDDYEILGLLGNSGIGELYLVRHAMSKKRFALKLLPPSASSDPEFESRFSAGGAAIAAHSHPHIVRIHKTGCRHDVLDYHYIVTDYVEGPQGRPLSLQDVFDFKGGVSERQCKKIALQICDALDYAHTCPEGAFLHSDLKPSNILFDPAGLVKVSDFETITLLGRRYFRDIMRDCINKSIAQSIKANSPADNATTLKTTAKVLIGKEEEQTNAYLLLGGRESLRIPDFGLGRLFRRMRNPGGGWNPMLEQTGEMSMEEEKSFRRPDSPADATTPGKKALNSTLETYDYMSPEQKAGQEPTPASNIYSTGLILYRMLTGRKMGGCWEMPSDFGAGRAWNAVLRKCLAPEPESRYQSVAEMKAALESVRAKDDAILIASLASVALLLIMAIAAAIAFGEHFDFNLMEVFKGGASGSNLIKLKNDPFTKFQMTLKVEPPGAKARLSKDGQTIVESASVSPEGFEFYSSPGIHLLEAEAEGFLPLYAEFNAGPESKALSFKMSKTPPKKSYAWLKDMEKPKIGFPWRIKDIGLTLLPVEAGEFASGCGLPPELRGADESPLAKTVIEQPFWMAEKETAQSQFEEIMWRNPSFFKIPGVTTPVERVTWQEANEFCNRLTARERTAGRLPEGFIFRLPTEAEWEYCARAGTASLYSFGDRPKDASLFGWHSENSGSRTHPAGELHPNAWGFYDMHGNVWEWCADRIRQQKAGEDGESLRYVCRGGGWDSPASKLRSCSRQTIDSHSEAGTSIGFRIVLAKPTPQ